MTQETVAAVKPQGAVSFTQVAWAGCRGGFWGGLTAFVAACGFTYWLVWSERGPDGHMNWDRAVGIGLLPIFSVPPGILLGFVLGMIGKWSLSRWGGKKETASIEGSEDIQTLKHQGQGKS